MTKQLFNSIYETATRLTLCLPLLAGRHTLDQIAAVDLAATYMKEFGYGERNLHGDSPYVLAEFDARRKRVSDGLKCLVVEGLALTSGGGLYCAGPECDSYAQALHGLYVEGYRVAVMALSSIGVEEVLSRVLGEGMQDGE